MPVQGNQKGSATFAKEGSPKAVATHCRWTSLGHWPLELKTGLWQVNIHSCLTASLPTATHTGPANREHNIYTIWPNCLQNSTWQGPGVGIHAGQTPFTTQHWYWAHWATHGNIQFLRTQKPLGPGQPKDSKQCPCTHAALGCPLACKNGEAFLRPRTSEAPPVSGPHLLQGSSVQELIALSPSGRGHDSVTPALTGNSSHLFLLSQTLLFIYLFPPSRARSLSCVPPFAFVEGIFRMSAVLWCPDAL